MYAFHFVLRLILINTNFAFRHTSIQYDACDENSWDFVGERYPLSNACGQLGQVSLSLQNSQSALCWFESLIYRFGQSYQDYYCSPEEAHMECEADPDMSLVGVTHAKVLN